MLPKKFRLSKKEFEEIREKGKLVSGRLMGILIQTSDAGLSDGQTARQSDSPKAGQPAEKRPTSRERIVRAVGEWQAKAGIIVSKKISNKAVVRNKLKRRIRAALQLILPDLSPALRFVVLPNKRAIGAEVKELEEDLKDILFKFQIPSSKLQGNSKFQAPSSR